MLAGDSEASTLNGESLHQALDPETIRHAYLTKLLYQQAKPPELASLNDKYLALAYAVRDRMIARWLRSEEVFSQRDSRTVAYLSAEYLLGPQLGTNLLYLGITDAVREALAPLDVSLDALLAQEEEPGLGNGGLGRLAACYMDSLASTSVPAIGYGLRYEYGIFDQEIRDGQQVEIADKWLQFGNPWEIARTDLRMPVGFGGSTQTWTDAQGRYRVRWTPERIVEGTAYDTPILGYGTDNANYLRLWGAVAAQSFNFQAFNEGDYYGAVVDKIRSETISKVLYPNDSAESGKQLRLEQQYLLVSCSLQDMLRQQLANGRGLARFADKFAIQMNDTHPALSVAELMRLLIDEHDLGWDDAFAITLRCLGYTNHTLLPEALETWRLPLFQRLLPRHFEIVLEINRRFLAQVRAKFPGDEGRVQRMSLIDERDDRAVRMAHLACVGSHAINGVAALHTDLLRETILRDFAEMYPERFCNVTNGVTPRRFVALSNPSLAGLITESIGEGWLSDLERLRELERFADDAAFRERFQRVKRANKQLLARHVEDLLGVELDPDSMFDVQVKRIHEYKRQLLNALHAIALYRRIRAGEQLEQPRTLVFAGKAAPGYAMAKLIIRFLNDVAATLQGDAEVRKSLTVVFVPDFNVKVGERIYPAVDLSEQISTAGKEASGTGNMKMSLNGALTIGTLDGANLEIRERVGAENFFLFGLTAPEVHSWKASGYRPWELVQRDSELREVIGLIEQGHFAGGDTGRYAPLVRSLVDRDEYMILADFRAYSEAQATVSAAFDDSQDWTRRAILNVARMGHFSSDRAVREYCEMIWKVSPVR